MINNDYTQILKNIPNVKKYVLHYLFEDMELVHKPNTLWMEFGVFSGKSINYISNFTDDIVYGFDSFYGLPEDWRDGFGKGAFNMNGKYPRVNKNVKLIPGLFEDTLSNFLNENEQKISFIHMDADLYSSTKYVLNALKSRMDAGCIVLFDELVNYPGYDGNNGELRALYEFIQENKIKYEWVAMNGTLGMIGSLNEPVAIKILEIG